MTDIAPTTPLGELVLLRSAAVPLLERLQLDYCCGGHRTLEEACVQRGLDAHTVIAMLEALGTDAGPGVDPHDIGGAAVAGLCGHIVKAHHDKTRRKLPRVGELLATVVRVHGAQRAELADLQRIFAGMLEELEQHFALEEELLFPVCRALEAGEVPGGVDQDVLAMCEHTHELTGEALAALRELCGGYDSAQAPCGTHRALLDALHRLELDLHQHVHEENTAVSPRVRELAAAESAP